jgi:hypothetical protein
MHKALMIAVATLPLSVGLAVQAQAPLQQAPPEQTAPQQAPPLRERPAAPKLNLTLEQRYTIREIIKEKKAEGTAVDATAAVGDPVPQGVTTQAMPSDVGEKVPQVKAHRYFLTQQNIVIVDPKDNRVAEVIKLTAD